MTRILAPTMYTPAGQLAAWFERAANGAVTRYASAGGPLDPDEPTYRLVRDWMATGEVVPHEGYVDGDPERCRVIRRVRRTEKTEPARRVRIDDEAWRETPKGRVFLAVVRAANFERKCPSNGELAQSAGLRDADQARYQLRLLSDEGRIRIVVAGLGNTERRIQIVETGRWTA